MSEKDINAVIARVSRAAVEKLNKMGVRPEELIFMSADGKTPVVNPILQALSYEFLQFEEFKIPENNKCHSVEERENLSQQLMLLDSKCELAVSKVLASPWASISTIRGRMISAVSLSEMIKSKYPDIEIFPDIENPDSSHLWTHSIYGGYSSSQEEFNPIQTCFTIFCKKIEEVKPIMASVTTVNNIPERMVGWKLKLKAKPQ